MELENEKIIRSFLLGEMAEKERFKFEAQFIADADLFEQIKVIEDELIEKYVRGWMNPTETSKFEKNFFTTKKRHERVEFSRQLFSKLEAQKQEVVAVKKNDGISSEESVWQKLAGLFLMPKVALTTAFALLMAVFGSWLLYQNLDNKKIEIVENQNSYVSETPKQLITPAPTISTDILQQNSTKNSATSDIKKDEKIEGNSSVNKILPKPQPPKTPPKEISVQNPVLALFAGTLRSEGKTNVLKLPKDSKGAVLQLNLESVNYKIYQAEITDAEGNSVYRKNNLKTKKNRISLFVPANKIKRGDYLIRLSGKNDSDNESVADFQFRLSQ